MFGFQKRPLFLFDADAGGNSGGGAGGNSGGSNGGTGEGDKPKQEEKKSYTQAELDAMFADRAKQGASSAVASLLKKLGYEKPEDLEAVVSEGKKSLDEKKTEADKAAEALAKLAKERDEAKTAADAAIAKATERVMRAEVIAEAVKQNFRPEAVPDVWLLVDRTKITEDGDTFKGIKEAVEAVAKAKPFWLLDPKKPAGGSPPSKREGGSGSGQAVKDGAKEGQVTGPTLRL